MTEERRVKVESCKLKVESFKFKVQAAELSQQDYMDGVVPE